MVRIDRVPTESAKSSPPREVGNGFLRPSIERFGAERAALARAGPREASGGWRAPGFQVSVTRMTACMAHLTTIKSFDFHYLGNPVQVPENSNRLRELRGFVQSRIHYTLCAAACI